MNWRYLSYIFILIFVSLSTIIVSPYAYGLVQTAPFPLNANNLITSQVNCDPSVSSGILCITTSGLNGVVLDQTQKFLIVIESTGGNPNPQQISVTGQELKDFRVEVPQGTYSVLVKQQTNVGDLDPEFIDVTFDEDILLLSGQCTNESINIQQVNRCVIIFSQFG